MARAGVNEMAANCPYCHEPADSTGGETLVGCPTCKVTYHQDCWAANGNRCAILNCRGAGPGVAMGAAALPIIVMSESVIMDKTTNSGLKPGASGRVDCPHCGGKTVCNPSNRGSCLRCLWIQDEEEIGYVVLCGACGGEGEIELPKAYTICKHCAGTGICRHGVAGGPCRSCLKYGEEYFAGDPSGARDIPSMCSICEGLGFRETPSSQRDSERNRW